MPFSFADNMDSLEKRVKTFFSNAKKMKPQDKENEYELIRKDYYKTLEDAGEITVVNTYSS
jgi:inhibitor of growth protein 3